MCCVVKPIRRRNQARVKNADLRHPSRTIVMQRRKSASPVLNVHVRSVALRIGTAQHLVKESLAGADTVSVYCYQNVVIQFCGSHYISNKMYINKSLFCASLLYFS